MIFGENPSEAQSVTELLQTENLSVIRAFSREKSLSLESESIKPLPNSNYPQEKRSYSLNKDGDSVLTKQSLFDGLINIEHDPIFKSKKVKIGDEIYKIDLNPEQTKSYKIPFPKSNSQDFEITACKPIEYSKILDQEISSQKIKVKFNDEGEINVYNADDNLLTKYTSQGDRIDYDSAGKINIVIDKNGTLYQFKESQPYNKSKGNGIFHAYEPNLGAKKIFSTGHGRNIATYDPQSGQASTTVDTPEP
jgi:hypothetical protein